jgi:hypothetical protein
MRAAILLSTLPMLLAGCYETDWHYRDKRFAPGGVYVSYVQERGRSGCEALAHGDLIQSVDGNAVATTKDLGSLADGQPHALEFWDASAGAQASATITAEPNNSMPPLEDAPPFWSVAASQLKKTPTWARRRLFGHAVPQILLVDIDGGFVTGRDLYGAKHLLVMFDWAATSDRQNGALSMQVLQKAQADLGDAGVDILFAQVTHPQQRKVAAMTDTDLRQFFADNQVRAEDGGPLPPPPQYRTPTKAEHKATPALGLEGPFTFDEAIGEAPNIFLINEDGIIVWHSAGPIPDPEGKISVDMVYTIVSAVEFALANL